MNYQVLLYYKYMTIDDPRQFAQGHLAFCKAHHLKGKIPVSTKGISGTLSGIREEAEQYMAHMHAGERFKDIAFKIDEVEKHAFEKMRVRLRKEIVALDLENDIGPRHTTGQYLSPVEFRKALKDGNIVIIDIRNNYEFNLGHFRGVIRPNTICSRDLPDRTKENKALFTDKKVVTYYTGGIRHEKFSRQLLKEGSEDVAQLHGGIAIYGKDSETKGEYWDGEMYVFDGRISVDINQVEKIIIDKDWLDGKSCERYTNCANPECNKQILVSEENEIRYLGVCSYGCAKHERNCYIQANSISNNEWQQRLTNFDGLYQHAQF